MISSHAKARSSSHAVFVLLLMMLYLLVAAAKGQVALLPADPLASYNAYDGVPGGSVSVVPVPVGSGAPITQALRVESAGAGEAIYSAAVYWDLTQPLAQGDVGLLSFWAKLVAPVPGELKVLVVVERNSDYEKSLATGVPLDNSGWRRYDIPFRVTHASAAGGTSLRIQFSGGAQTFEVGGIALSKYAPGTDPNSLPRNFYYAGRDANAPWRAQAAAAIQQHRTSPVRVIVQRPDGSRVDNASVTIVQQRRKFGFGSAVAADRVAGTDSDAATYRNKIRDLFDVVVIENHLKWPFFEEWNRQETDSAFAWLESQNIPIRGHNLIWPSWGNMPADTVSLAPTSLRNRINAHFDLMLTSYAGRIYEWDVVNEPYDNIDVQGRIPGVPGVPASTGVLGNNEIVAWYQRARQTDPAMRLALNDYNLLESDDANHRAYTLALLQWMLAQGAPVDTLGLQGHFGIVSVPTLQQRIAQFAALPVRLAITEYDTGTADDQLQADYLRDVMTIAFAEPKFDQFLMWGFWENAHWRTDGAMFRSDWSPKPAAAVWQNLARGAWWTNAAGATNSTGEYTSRAYHGDVLVTASVPGQPTASRVVQVDASATPIDVVLYVPPLACDSIDFNNDSSLFDPQDIDAFLSVYSEGPCIPASATCNDIDFNNDGSLFDPCDIDAFLLVFSEGPCTPCGS